MEHNYTDGQKRLLGDSEPSRLLLGFPPVFFPVHLSFPPRITSHQIPLFQIHFPPYPPKGYFPPYLFLPRPPALSFRPEIPCYRKHKLLPFVCSCEPYSLRLLPFLKSHRLGGVKNHSIYPFIPPSLPPPPSLTAAGSAPPGSRETPFPIFSPSFSMFPPISPARKPPPGGLILFSCSLNTIAHGCRVFRSPEHPSFSVVVSPLFVSRQAEHGVSFFRPVQISSHHGPRTSPSIAPP